MDITKIDPDHKPAIQNRVARLLAQHTKTGTNIPNIHKIYHMAVKYTNIFHC
jgi:hypothetical protein